MKSTNIFPFLKAIALVSAIFISQNVYAEDWVCIHGHSGKVHPQEEINNTAQRFGSGLKLYLPEYDITAAGWVQYNIPTNPYELYDEIEVQALVQNGGDIKRIDLWDGDKLLASKSFNHGCSEKAYISYVVKFNPKHLMGAGISILPISRLPACPSMNGTSSVNILKVCLR
jgi:hypothetical protein